MITFNSRIITIITIGFIMYLAYSQYNDKYNLSPAVRAEFSSIAEAKQAKNAKYKIQIPQAKEQKDYNPLEKLIYQFARIKNEE